jgi:hypothetical protein
MAKTDLIYPSCVVNLRLRFDETLRLNNLPEPGPQGGDPTAVVVVPIASTGNGRRTPKVSLGTAFRETQSGDFDASTRPLITQTGADNLSFVQNRIPKSASVECPNYRTAGKFSLEFDWRELPIDPRLVRSASVEIYMGSVPADEFSRGMVGLEPNGRRASVMDIGGVFSASQPRDDLMVLSGLADSWYVQHNESGSIVKIEGRDLRGSFIDSPVDPEVMNKLNLDQSVVDVVGDIILTHPVSAYMKVRHNPGDWPGGTPPRLLDTDGLTRVRRGADGKKSGGGTTDDDISMWDLITRYCDLVGAVPYFRGRSLVIRPAQALHDPSKPRMDTTVEVFAPQPRVDDDGNPFFERKMVFGRNIKELTFERKLSGVKVPVVELVSFDTSSAERGARKMLVEQWPPKTSPKVVATKQQPLFSGEGPEFYDRAFAENRRYAIDPPWLTVLSPADEASFRAWVSANRVPFDPNAEIVDYDMRGYWLDEIKPGGVWDGDHFPDTWKTPYDTTFSAESKYAIPSCPLKWEGDRLFNTDTGRLIFGAPAPAPSNTDRDGVGGLPSAARVTSVLPSGEVSQTDKLRISVPGVRDPKKLIALAKQLYEEIGRGELGGSCSTSMISSFKGDNDDPDLLRLRPGDQVEFVTDIRQLRSYAPNVSALTDATRRPFDEEVKFVKESMSGKAGVGDENLARVIVASARSQIMYLLRTFRVGNVVFNWSLTSGTQISFDFQNYFVPRYQIGDLLGPNTEPTVNKTIVSNKAKRPKVKIPIQPKLKVAPRKDPFFLLGSALETTPIVPLK